MTAIYGFAKATAKVFLHGQALAGFLLVGILFLLSSDSSAQVSGQPVPSLSQLDTIMQTYMAQYSSPGASLAVTVNGHLVFARGYGYAKVDTGEFVQPDSLFRIASNSKPITAAGIYKLIEQGKLSLATQPFVTILNNLTPPTGTTIDPRVSSITIEELLQHTAGYDDTLVPDPANYDAVIAATTFGAEPPASPELLIRYVLGQPLQHAPGTTYAYSNFGYIVLGYVIEQVSGMPYETYIQNNVFDLAGISRTKPGADLLSGRLPDEVAYYDYPGASLVQSVETTVVPTPVPFPYGGYSCTLELANGCWVASAMDLLRFTDSVNGQFSTSIFTTYPTSNPFRTPAFYFAIPPSGPGWEYVFYGSLPGTNSLVHLITDTATTGKVSYAALFNTRSGANIEEPEFDADNAILAFVKTVTSWPSGDLFPAYSGSAGSCSFSLSANTQDAAVGGSTLSVSVTDANYCAWSAVSNSTWIHVTSGALNSNSGPVGYTVDPNTGSPRSGTIAIAGKTLTVNQAGTGAAPTITSLVPFVATAGSVGFPLTINGMNFTSGATAKWAAMALATTFVSSTQLTATVPAALIASVGTAEVTVSASGASSNPETFTVIPNSNFPLALQLSPDTATSGGTGITLLTVYGANFASGSKVLWNGALRSTTFVSTNQLQATILASDIADQQTVLVTVTDPAPNPATSAAMPFAVVSINPVATIQGASLAVATDGAGNHVLSLTGTDFIFGSAIDLGTVSLTTTYLSPWHISALVTASESTKLPAAVTVVNSAGTSANFELP